jgi:TRAP-type C4-dicarboxylate transport system substrate-binding protein
MRHKSKLYVLAVLFGSALICFTGFFWDSAHAQKAVEWKMLTSWTPEAPQMKNIFIPLVDKINQRAAGKLKITWFGPEAVPAFEQLKPVREGVFDALFTHPAYHKGEISLAQGLDLVTATAKERHDAGMFKIIDEAYRKRKNVTYIGAVPDGVGYNILLKKKIDKADLKGLKIRTNPFYDPLVKALGGAPVTMPPGELYSALEKGVVDGATFPCLGTIDYKWHEVTKYAVRPRFGETNFSILVNLNSWNKLPKDTQEILMKTVVEMEEEGRKTMSALYPLEEKEMLKRGMELIVLPPPEAQKYLSTFYERSWAELVVQPDPEYGPRLKAAADRMKKK